MARKLTAQNRRFRAASNACIRKGPKSWAQFGKCMSSKLGGRRRRKSRRGRKR